MLDKRIMLALIALCAMVAVSSVDSAPVELQLVKEYDQINNDLMSKEVSQDPEANLKAAEEILSSLDDKEGAYARALEQLLSLRTILTEESCNEQGMEIIKNNDLATGGEALKGYTDDSRRLTHVVKYYLIQHAKVCHPIYMEKVLPHANEVDLKTYKSVLALIGSHWFIDDSNQLNSFLREVEDKHNVGLDFTTPMLEECDKTIGTASIDYLDGQQMLDYMNAVTKVEPQISKFFGWAFHGKKDDGVTQKDKVAEFYEEHVIKPCEKFISAFGSDMENFNFNFSPFSGAISSDLPAPLNFRLLSSAYNTCQFYINHQSDNISRMNF